MSGLYEAAKAVVDSLSDGPVFADSVEADNLTTALSAQQATWRERREKSPWKGPFFAQRGARDGEEGPEWNGMWEVADQQIDWVCERSEYDEANAIAAALNEHFGFSADGSVDYLEDK